MQRTKDDRDEQRDSPDDHDVQVHPEAANLSHSPASNGVKLIAMKEKRSSELNGSANSLSKEKDRDVEKDVDEKEEPLLSGNKPSLTNYESVPKVMDKEASLSKVMTNNLLSCLMYLVINASFVTDSKN